MLVVFRMHPYKTGGRGPLGHQRHMASQFGIAAIHLEGAAFTEGGHIHGVAVGHPMQVGLAVAYLRIALLFAYTESVGDGEC